MDRDLDWDGLHPLSQPQLIDAKRAIVAADAERVGCEDDWRLRVLQLRERREDERSDHHRAAAARLWADPSFRAKASRARAKAWSDGKYSHLTGKQRSPELTATMLQMRATGMTNSEIAGRLRLTAGAVWFRIGGQRKKPHRSAVTAADVAALRAKGLSFARCAVALGCSERTARDRLRVAP